MQEKYSLREAYGEKLVQLISNNKNIVVFDADLSSSTQTKKVKDKYPENHFNMGIAENNMCLFASGMSRTNKIVFASSFAIFLAGRSWEMIRNSIAYDNLNVKLVSTHAGVTVGEDGGSHQMNEDIALMRVIPNMEVIVPADRFETQSALDYVVSHNKPSYIRLTRDKGYDIFDSSYKYIPNAIISLRENINSSFVIFTTGIITGFMKQVLDKFEKQNIFLTHFHVSSIKPLNKEKLQQIISSYKGIITFEEHSVIGGLGDSILDAISTNPKPLFKYGIQDIFTQSGGVSDLLDYYGLSESQIESTLQQLIQKFD